MLVFLKLGVPVEVHVFFFFSCLVAFEPLLVVVKQRGFGLAHRFFGISVVGGTVELECVLATGRGLVRQVVLLKFEGVLGQLRYVGAIRVACPIGSRRRHWLRTMLQNLTWVLSLELVKSSS